GVAGYYATYYGDAPGPFVIGRITILAGISIVAMILVAVYYFASRADSGQSWVEFYKFPENLRLLLGLAAVCLVAGSFVFFREVGFDITNVMKKSYLLATRQ